MHLILIPAAFLIVRNYLNEYHNLTMLKLSINSILPCSLRSSRAVVLFECTEEKAKITVRTKTSGLLTTHVIEKFCRAAFFG